MRFKLVLAISIAFVLGVVVFAVYNSEDREKRRELARLEKEIERIRNECYEARSDFTSANAEYHFLSKKIVTRPDMDFKEYVKLNGAILDEYNSARALADSLFARRVRLCKLAGLAPEVHQ